MNVTATGLTKAAGAAAAVAGAIFIAVQINHPPMVVASVDTTEWALRNTAKVVMAALALAGITGMYLRQVRQMGVLGLVGYLLFSAGYLVILAIAFLSAYVLPSLADTAPGYVQDLLVAAEGGSPVGDIGLMQGAFAASGVGYMVGGLIFGVALFRAGVLARWAAALLAVATIGTGCARGAARVVQPADGGPRRHRADRPRHLPVAHPAHPTAPRRRPPPPPPTSSPARSDDHPARRHHDPGAPGPEPVSGLAGPGRAAGPVRHPADGGHPAADPARRWTGADAGRRPVHRLPGRAGGPHRRRRRVRARRDVPVRAPASAAGTGPGTAAPAGSWPWPGSRWPGRRCG